jgi:transcriptional regulatory protein RtcR
MRLRLNWFRCAPETSVLAIARTDLFRPTRLVSEEIGRLQYAWSGFGQQQPVDDGLAGILSEQALLELDLFDRLQLAEVVLVCRASRSLAETGRVLFNHSRTQKASANDSHRLKQYLQKFGLEFQAIVKSS